MNTTPKQSKSKKHQRNRNGFSIAEFGPALLVLLIGFFLPLLDLISIGLDYASGDLLNSLQLREAARVPASEAIDPSGYVQGTIPQEWSQAGVGRFVKLDSPIKTNVAYQAATSDSNGIQDQMVQLTTTFTAKPFLTIPLVCPGLPGVPGLTGPMSFTFTSHTLLENPGFVKQ